MAVTVRRPGRLISVDGTRSKDTLRAADALVTALKARGVECAISRWDASGLFHELVAGAGDRVISMRTLSLVYAADLAFRLRWEIVPILDAGGVVIAASYVETAAAFGTVCGVDERWIRELLRFAPAAQYRYLAPERKLEKTWKRRTERGYAEYCAALLEASAPECVSRSARRDMIAALADTRSRGLDVEKAAAAIAKSATGSRRASSR